MPTTGCDRGIGCSGAVLGLALALLGSSAMASGARIPPNTFPVKPVVRGPRASGGDLRVVQGRYFSYALPENWQVGEEGPYAVTLVAPDRRAFTLMVGNAGMLPNYPLDRYVRERMASIGPQNLQLGRPVQIAPPTGFQYAYQFELTYMSQRGNPSHGLVRCAVAPAYDSELIVMMGAFSVEDQWPGYAAWLPLSAQQISAIDGAAFGRRGIMAQNLRLSQEYGEAARAYREWSRRNWQAVTDQRTVSADAHHYDVRENLGTTKAYVNPYDISTPVELPPTYQRYWVNRQGTYVGTNDPSVNPNDGSTDEWRQVSPVRP